MYAYACLTHRSSSIAWRATTQTRFPSNWPTASKFGRDFAFQPTGSPCHFTRSQARFISGQVPNHLNDKQTTKKISPSIIIIPSPPPRKDSKHYLTQGEIDDFMKPLYRLHWSVTISPGQVTPYLSKNFRLAGYNATLSFVNDIATIAQQEMHHPKITFEYNYVEVSTQTHDVEHPEASYALNTGNMGSKPLPGITPSDIRLALLVEKHFSEVFATDGRGRPTRKSKRLLGQTPTTPVEIQNLYNVDTS